MKTSVRFKRFAAASVVALLAAGCGSSSDDPTTPSTQPLPPMVQEDQAASATVAGFIAFVQTLIASMTAETNEPRSIGGITPPVSDNAEPSSI
jgi:hypothetical protein